MKNEPFVIERTFDAPSDVVWKALTDVKALREWYFNVSDFKPEPGFTFSFEGGDGTISYVHRCEVKEVVPGRKVSYTWAYENYPGSSLLTFELFPEDGRTRVKLTHAGLETFPYQQDKNFSRESFTAGWTEIIGKLLPDYLAKVEEGGR
ncbi:SRPBCC family protein [Chitinophaga lutea]